MYLTFEEYTANGGTASEKDFPVLEMKARKRLDYLTFNRIQTPDNDIKLLMVELIRLQQEFDSHESGISGYGNDGVSVSYVSPDVAKKEFEAKADTLIVSVVGDLAYRGLN